MRSVTQEAIQHLVDSSVPERLSLESRPPILNDHGSHFVQLAQDGQTALAADHLLFPEINGALARTVAEVIRKLNILFAVSKPVEKEPADALEKRVHLRQYSYEALLETALNFWGLESRWLIEDEKSESAQYILAVLDEWETLEHQEGEISIAAAVITKWLARMKRVQKGSSMAAKTAARIEAALDFRKNVLVDFLKQAEQEIKGNIYYQMVKEEKCKFGNDYALGLRWLRHLGFEQVSTNPVLAARAYQDEPRFVEIFREELKHQPNARQWIASPSTHGEEIALFATLLALWDNLHVFRPIFFNLREKSGGGVVSFQLNPNIAHLVDESIRDVFKAFTLASENLSVYDQYLLSGYPGYEERGRPNLVIKVAATSPAAREVTRTINGLGCGSNITVDYSVSQEATLILEEMEGMARAVRKGIKPTQLYMTNMGGRLESHLREVKLEDLFGELKKKVGEEEATQRIVQVSEANRTKEKLSKAGTYEEKVRAVTRFAHGQKKIDEPISEALKDVTSRGTLWDWEDAISRSGTLVARRVWKIFFSEPNRELWMEYLVKKHQLSHDQAQLIMDRIHYLPASKRKPFDTFWTLASRNLVHTEFPDHQENVRRMAEETEFSLEDYEESILHTFPPETLERLNQMEDFRKAYEINRELAGIFEEVGIAGDFGLEGLEPSAWSEFGPVQKTLSEFKAAYDTFQLEMISILKGFAHAPKKTPLKKTRKKPG